MSTLTGRLKSSVASGKAAKLAVPVPVPVYIAALMGRAALEAWVRRRLRP